MTTIQIQGPVLMTDDEPATRTVVGPRPIPEAEQIPPEPEPEQNDIAARRKQAAADLAQAEKLKPEISRAGNASTKASHAMRETEQRHQSERAAADRDLMGGEEFIAMMHRHVVEERDAWVAKESASRKLQELVDEEKRLRSEATAFLKRTAPGSIDARIRRLQMERTGVKSQLSRLQVDHYGVEAAEQRISELQFIVKEIDAELARLAKSKLEP